MRIYILRHGIAEEGAPGQPDSERRLTDRGKEKLRKILSRAREAGVAPEVILTSPYVRSKETAVMAKEELGFEDELAETNSLTPASSASRLWDEIRTDYGGASRVMLAGHNPLLSDFACFLTGAPVDAIVLKKGALALVEIENLGPSPSGTLLWLMTAKTAGS